MQNKKMKKIKFYESPKEGIENRLREPIENILVAHHLEIQFSYAKMEEIYKEVSIIANQNKLQISFSKEYTDSQERLLLEKSLIQN